MNFTEEIIQSFMPSEPGMSYMWMLLFLLALSLFFIVKNFIFLNRSSNLNAPLFIARIRQALEAKNNPEAVRLCDSAGKRALPWIVKGAILKSEEDARGTLNALEERTVSVIPRLEKGLAAIAMLANISTLIGLMGTIYGLILAFAAVGAPDVSPAQKSSMLADGIAAAMNTTLLGLTISIPCIMAYTMLRNKADAVITDIDRYTPGLISILAPDALMDESYKPSERRNKAAVNLEPDLVPIMGLMVTLIPLLLSSAEFIKVGQLNISLPQAAGADQGGDEEEPQEPPKELALGLIITAKGFSLISSLDAPGKVANTAEKPPDIPVLKDGKPDYATLNEKLMEMKKKAYSAMMGVAAASLDELHERYLSESKTKKFRDYPDFQTVKLLAENSTHYNTVVAVMDAARIFKDKDGKKHPLFPEVSIGVMQ